MNQAINAQKKLGNQGEELIASWLKKQNFSILARNYRTKWGEIDLVVAQGEVIAFVEVKTRKTQYFPLSLVVTTSKQRKIIKTAKHFISQYQITNKVLRFDVATITFNNYAHEIDYIRNAFQGE
jgi:putative endonuclease